MAMTSSVVGPRNSKALAKAKLAPKKVMVTGGLLPVWPTTAFWIPAKPLHLRSMLCKFMRCTKNGWSQHWSTEKDLILLHNNVWLYITQPALQKLKELGYKILLHPPYSPDLSPTNYHFFKHLNNLLQGKCFHKQQEAEKAFQEFVNSQSTGFYATGISKLISCWKKCFDWNGSCFY